MQYQNGFLFLSAQERVFLQHRGLADYLPNQIAQAVRIWSCVNSTLFGATHPRARNHLHGASDFSRLSNAPDSSADYLPVV